MACRSTAPAPITCCLASRPYRTSTCPSTPSRLLLRRCSSGTPFGSGLEPAMCAYLIMGRLRLVLPGPSKASHLVLDGGRSDDTTLLPSAVGTGARPPPPVNGHRAHLTGMEPPRSCPLVLVVRLEPEQYALLGQVLVPHGVPIEPFGPHLVRRPVPTRYSNSPSNSTR